jgi:hypothetical protein
MLLHQPTLMHSFEGQILQLLPNSRELSMSSAKTVADILAFAELIDPKSFIGNPFTSQPMYIAACAFLMESAAQTSSQPTSRDTSPPSQKHTQSRDKYNDQKQKHSLLASAATQNYQRCYKSLQQLETYWAGTRYILVALDQKAKGIWDPETYTEQEYEATKIRHDMIPDWRQKLSLAAPSPSGRFSDFGRSPRMDASSPANDPVNAFGFSLTGTTNSPNSNLTFMYQNTNGDPIQQPPLPPGPGNMMYDPIRQGLPEGSPTSTSNYPPRYQSLNPVLRQTSGPMPPPAQKYASMTSDHASTSDAEMLLGLQHSPFSQSTGTHHSFETSQAINTPTTSQNDYNFEFSPQNSQMYSQSSNNYIGLGGIGDMMMESQEIDMSSLGNDMIPWLEYLPQDMLQLYDSANGAGMGNGQLNDGNMGSSDRNGG